MKDVNARLSRPVIQQRPRLEAIDLFLTGKSPTYIPTQGVSRQSVYNWIKRHASSGKRALRNCKQGCPKGTQLQPWQSAQVVNLIKNYCPDQLSMPFFYGLENLLGY